MAKKPKEFEPSFAPAPEPDENPPATMPVVGVKPGAVAAKGKRIKRRG